MVDLLNKESYGVHDLIKIMRILRGDAGCPWDREQTHKSIRQNFLEEAYEAVEAIDREDAELLKEELGDVLLQIVFHAQMEEEGGRFSFDDVADRICKKLILRHPHIFSDVAAKDSKTVLSNWEEIKKSEKGYTRTTDSIKNIASTLPALMRAQKIQAKVTKVGFDWPSVDGAYEKLQEEILELKAARTKAQMCDELGDVLFSVVNIARFLEIDAEYALEKANEKFTSRFAHIEARTSALGLDMESMTSSELDELWEQAKTK